MEMSLRDLYDAAAEDVVFGLGLMPVSDGQCVPYLHLFYRDWCREMLEIIRESFGSGLVLTHSERTPGRIDVFIATREQVAVHGFCGGETSILRAAAWDAQLADVEAVASRVFEDERARQGHYVVLMQTREWEFLTSVSLDGSTAIGDITPRTFPMPPGI